MSDEEHAVIYFDNGYGVSILRREGVYSSETTHEVGLLHRVTNNVQHRVCSLTDLAPYGVKGWRTGDEVAEFIKQAVALPMVEYCAHKRKEED